MTLSLTETGCPVHSGVGGVGVVVGGNAVVDIVVVGVVSDHCTVQEQSGRSSIRVTKTGCPVHLTVMGAGGTPSTTSNRNPHQHHHHQCWCCCQHCHIFGFIRPKSDNCLALLVTESLRNSILVLNFVQIVEFVKFLY